MTEQWEYWKDMYHDQYKQTSNMWKQLQAEKAKNEVLMTLLKRLGVDMDILLDNKIEE